MLFDMDRLIMVVACHSTKSDPAMASAVKVNFPYEYRSQWVTPQLVYNPFSSLHSLLGSEIRIVTSHVSMHHWPPRRRVSQPYHLPLLLRDGLSNSKTSNTLFLVP